MHRCTSRLPSIAFLSAAAFSCPHLLAQVEGEKHEPHEKGCDPPALILPGPDDRSSPAPLSWPRGFPAHVQVNTDPNGRNILGDAGNEPSIAVDPTAPLRMAVGWRQFDSITSDFRQAGFAYSADGGRTWSTGVIDPGIARSDPILRSDSQGRFLYNSYRFVQSPLQVNLFVSNDGGQTWGGGTNTGGGDKVWFAIDTTKGIGAGNVYQAWNRDVYNRSINAGQNFQQARFFRIGWTGTVAVGLDGTVYAVGDNNIFGRSFNMQDPNATPSFEERTMAWGSQDVSFAPPNPGGLLGQRWVDVDRSDGPRRGWVYVCDILRTGGSDPADHSIISSPDGGTTWNAPVRINNDSPGAQHWQWFSTMAVAPNGRIDVVWNDTRASNVANICETYYASSTDGGVTWTNQAPIGPAWNSHHGWPSQNKIGDYYDLHSDAVGADLIYSATYNTNPDSGRGEQDVYYVRLGQHDCNADAIGDEDQIAADSSLDCNANAIIDSCEIAAGTAHDANHNTVLDSCECLADWNTSGAVNSQDFFDFLAAFFEGC